MSIDPPESWPTVPDSPTFRSQVLGTLVVLGGLVGVCLAAFLLLVAPHKGGWEHILFQTDEVAGTLTDAELDGDCGHDDEGQLTPRWQLDYTWVADRQDRRGTLEQCGSSFAVGETESIWVFRDEVRSTDSPRATWTVGLSVIGGIVLLFLVIAWIGGRRMQAEER